MISNIKPNSIRQKALASLREYTPGATSISSDLTFMIVLCFLQLSIFQMSILHPLVIDLVTPCAALISVTNSLKRAIPINMLAAFLIETHSASPFGLYICSYWVITVTISLIKAHISWRQISSWVYVLLTAQAFILINTLLSQYLVAESYVFSIKSLGTCIFQLSFSVVLLQLMPRNWLYGDYGERSPW